MQADADGVIVDQEGLDNSTNSAKSTTVQNQLLTFSPMQPWSTLGTMSATMVQMIVSYCDLWEANACLHSAGSESMAAKTDNCCDMTTIIGMPTPATDRILLGTVTENKKLYTKREVAGADKARETLARMGYPVKQAMCSSGKNLVRYHRTRFLHCRRYLWEGHCIDNSSRPWRSATVIKAGIESFLLSRSSAS